ncbi:MAG TPA: T9SS type A sorting domain-containing protein, partial [Bacteroidia bacterium]|nr:T9SS type A sorting domain-containing protein [Bacteroidia bacterium]
QLLHVADGFGIGGCYNTSAGLKMIVNSQVTNTLGNVYSLGGNFLAATPEIGNGNNNYTLSNPYPDPSNSMIHLTYDLPAGTDKAEMVITNLNGQVVKTCNVGSAFSNILLDTKQYAPGEYLYYIHTDNYTSPASKFVISR